MDDAEKYKYVTKSKRYVVTRPRQQAKRFEPTYNPVESLRAVMNGSELMEIVLPFRDSGGHRERGFSSFEEFCRVALKLPYDLTAYLIRCPPWKSISGPVARLRPERVTRLGPKPQTQSAEFARIITAEPVQHFMGSMFAANKWNPTETGDAISYVHKQTHIRMECDDDLSFGPDAAIGSIARMGPSTVQTFLAMIGYWMENHRGDTHESYVTAYASDLMRFMGRKEVGSGGYHNADVLAKGNHVWLLKRLSIPSAQITRKDTLTFRIGELFMIQFIDVETTLDNGVPKSAVSFRYHLSDNLYQWIGGNDLQYRNISAKILRYHPNNEKFNILIGFCLAYFDRVNNRYRQTRRIGLTGALGLAGIDLPERNLPDFMKRIKAAVSDLERDGVIPGLKLTIPDDVSMSTRQQLKNAFLIFPPLQERLSLPAQETMIRSISGESLTNDIG